jgi:hypothetical protein
LRPLETNRELKGPIRRRVKKKIGQNTVDFRKEDFSVRQQPRAALAPELVQTFLSVRFLRGLSSDALRDEHDWPQANPDTLML